MFLVLCATHAHSAFLLQCLLAACVPALSGVVGVAVSLGAPVPCLWVRLRVPVPCACLLGVCLAEGDAPNLCFGALLPAWAFCWLAWRAWLLTALPLLVFLCAALVHTASLVPLVLFEPVVLVVSQGAYVLWFWGG